MSSFTKPLTVTKVDARRWRVDRSFTYIVDYEDKLESIEVEAGFITDFASVPRIFWIIMPPDGQYTQAAVLHDYCYAEALYTRRRCDEVFYEAMGVLGVSWLKRRIMWLGVRVGGWYGWRIYRKQEEARNEGKNNEPIIHSDL